MATGDRIKIVTENTISSIMSAAISSDPNKNFATDAELTKLSGIETGATADQTAGEIKTAYESNTNTNVFTDTQVTNLATAKTHADTVHNKAFVGLGNVDNTSDADKPVSTATATALSAKVDTNSIVDGLTSTSATTPLSANQGKVLKGSIDTHTDSTSNPHGVTASQVGLGSVDNTEVCVW